MSRTPSFFSIALLIVLTLQSAEWSFAASPELVPAAAQHEVLVHLSLEQSGSFSKALDALASQGHVAIVAEGVPLVPHLPKKDIADLTAPVPLSKAVTKVAASFDYDAQKQDNVFILTKRYTDPKELPCVTLGECRQAFKDILALLDKFNPDFDESSEDHSERNAVINLFASLPPSQLQAAQNKKLRYGELTPEQQGLVNSIFLCDFIQSQTINLQKAVDDLDYAPDSVLTGRDNGRNALFIELRAQFNNSLRYFHPLGGGISPEDGPLILPKQATDNMPAAPDPPTLEAVVGLLSHTGPPPAVDAVLKDKPVSVAGLKNVSPKDVLRALAVLYDLRISVSDAGGEELARQVLLPPTSLRDVAPGVWRLLPVSLVRALHQENAPPSQDTPADETKATDPREAAWHLQMEANRRLDQQIQSRTLLPGLWTMAVQQVIAGVQPQFRKGGLSVRIPVKSLDQATRRAVAVALSATSLEDLQSGFAGQVNQNVMNCLDDLNEALVYTVPAEAAIVHGRTVPSLYLEGTDPYTKQQIGLVGLRSFPSQ